MRYSGGHADKEVVESGAQVYDLKTYDMWIYICITNIQAQTTSMELVGIWLPLPLRR